MEISNKTTKGKNKWVNLEKHDYHPEKLTKQKNS